MLEMKLSQNALECFFCIAFRRPWRRRSWTGSKGPFVNEKFLTLKIFEQEPLEKLSFNYFIYTQKSSEPIRLEKFAFVRSWVPLAAFKVQISCPLASFNSKVRLLILPQFKGKFSAAFSAVHMWSSYYSINQIKLIWKTKVLIVRTHCSFHAS